MADALSDLVTLSQAASGLIGSYERLIDTRTMLEGARLTSEVNNQNASFLMRMNLKAGDPNRIDESNWRDELQVHSDNINARIGTIKSKTTKDIVQSNINGITNGFMTSIAEGMFQQEMDRARDDFGGTVTNLANNPLKSNAEKASEVNMMIESVLDPKSQIYGIYNKEQLSAIRASVYTPLAAKALAESTRESARLNASKEAESSGTEAAVITDESVALTLMAATGIDEAQKMGAIQVLTESQKKTDEKEKANWKNIFTANEKNDSVNIDQATVAISNSRASKEVKEAQEAELTAYVYNKQAISIEKMFQEFRARAVDNPTDARKAATMMLDKSKGSPIYNTAPGQELISKLQKEANSWTEGEAGAGATTRRVKAELIEYWQRFKHQGQANSINKATMVMKLYSDEARMYAPEAVERYLSNMTTGEDLISPQFLEQLRKNDGFINSLATSLAFSANPLITKEAKSFMEGVVKPGFDKYDATFDVFKAGIIDEVIKYAVDNGQRDLTGVMSDQITDILVSKLSSANSVFSMVKDGVFVKDESNAAKYLLDNAATLTNQFKGSDPIERRDALRQIGSIINEEVGKVDPAFEVGKYSTTRDGITFTLLNAKDNFKYTVQPVPGNKFQISSSRRGRNGAWTTPEVLRKESTGGQTKAELYNSMNDYAKTRMGVSK